MPLLRWLLSVCCLAPTLPLAAQVAAQPAPAYTSDPKFVAALKEADALSKGHRYVFAVDAYRKADKIAGGACRACRENMYAAQVASNDLKGALKTVAELKASAQTPLEKSVAESFEGTVLLRQAGQKPKPGQLEQAHAALAAALADYPKNNSARWNDACVLERLGKSDEAARQFSACADAASPKDPMRLRARHFAANPALSLERSAPAFEVAALDGTQFNLDNMGGKVVLIDFWATWCGPCNAELPHLQKIAREFSNDPLVILSISWDADEAKWKDFIGKHGMTWLQYRDADHSLSERFNVEAIPHYFTIDSDGVLTSEMLGSGSDVEGKLRKLIAKARDTGQVVVATLGAPAALVASR